MTGTERIAAQGSLHRAGRGIVRTLIGAAGLTLSAVLVDGVLGQTPSLPPSYPKAQYDESKVPQHTLPDR